MKYLRYMLIAIMLISITQFGFVEGNASVDTDNPRKHLLAGYDFSGVIMENDDVWKWGANESYQLGLKDNENRIYPTKQSGKIDSRNILEVISTDGATHVLMENGDVYRWGKSSPSQGALSTPTKIASNVSSVAHARVQALTNPHDAMAFVENGQVKVYGSSYQGQAGRGIKGYGANEQCTTTYNVPIKQRRPVLTSGTIENCSANSQWKTVKNGKPLTNIRMVEGSTSTRSFVAVTNNNEVYTWGQNHNMFATKNKNASIEDKIVKLAVGSKIYALTENGDLWEWFGTSGTPNKSSIKDVKDIQVQANSVMVLTESGDVYGRGNNKDGQLGNFGSEIKEFTRIKSNIKEIGLGSSHSLFEDNKGQIFGQGWNGYRQLANEDDGVKERFTKVNELSNVTHISSEIYSSFAIENNRNLLAWGGLTGGDLGGQVSSPRRIKTFESDVVRLNSNKEETTILTGVVLKDNKTYMWGHDYDNYNGHGERNIIKELKHNYNNAAYTPNTVNGATYVVKDEIGTSNDDLSIKDAVAGGYGGAAINMKGQLLTWGSNTGGMWGIGENHLRNAGSRGVVPKISKAFIKAKSNERFVNVNGESRTRIALQENGYVYSWGHDRNESLGRTGNNYLPMRISGLNNIEKISMGYSTGMALDDKNNLYSWGQNNKGQIGDGTVSNSKGIVNVSSLSGVKFKDIFSGRTSQFAITKSGDLYAWGDNRYGQLGLGGRFDRTSPRKVEGLPGPVKMVDNGEEHTVVLLENGDVYVAGADTFGQLGLDAKRSKVSYQEIPFPDYITLDTKDNVEKTIGEDLRIDGFVTSVVPGNPLEVKYEIESSNGIVEKGKIMDTTSTLDDNKFSKKIELDDKYTIGGYTINVTVKNKLSNIENTQTINFGVIDNVPPSKPEMNIDDLNEATKDNWLNDEISISIKDGVDKESGVNYTEYRINKGNWVEYKDSFVIDLEGEITIEARTVDNAGNIGPIAEINVKIDKTSPTVNLIPNTANETHENVIIQVNAKDEISGIKSITYLGKSMIADGTFQKKYEHWGAGGSGGAIRIENGRAFLDDNTAPINKLLQINAFVGSEMGAQYFAEIEARGKGVLNARYAYTSRKPTEENPNPEKCTADQRYAQELNSDSKFETYTFPIERRDCDNQSFHAERIGKDGWIEISSIKVYARKDITQSKELEVTQNGTYTFVVVDNADNVTTKSITINNIDKYTKLHKPTIDDFNVSTIEENIKSVNTPVNDLIVEDWRDNAEWSLQVHSSGLSNGKDEIPLLLNKINSIDKVEGSGNLPTSSHLNKKILEKDRVPIIKKNNSRGKFKIDFGDGLETEISPTTPIGEYNSKVTWEFVIAP